MFCINAVFCYQGINRAKKLPFQKWYFLPRYVFQGVGKSLLDCGVMIYHKDDIVPDNAVNLNCFIPILREMCEENYKPIGEKLF